MLVKESDKITSPDEKEYVCNKILYCSIKYGFETIVERLLRQKDIVFGQASICTFEFIERKNARIQELLLQDSNVHTSDYYCGKLVHFDNMQLIKMAQSRSNGCLMCIVSEALVFQKRGLLATILMNLCLRFPNKRIFLLRYVYIEK